MATGSDNIVIDLYLPTSWQTMSDKELRLVFRLLASGMDYTDIMVICLLRWNNIKVVGRTNNKGEFWLKCKKHLFRAKAKSIHNLSQPLAFIKNMPPVPVRYEAINRHKPLTADFDGVPFNTYIVCSNIYQGYLHTENMEMLQQLVRILYDSEKIKPAADECIMAFYWFAALKNMMANKFPNFYQKIDSDDGENLMGGKSLHQRLTDEVNAQIRALTGGDVTKEDHVLQMDTIRALTELDAKAYEIAEMKRREKNTHIR